MPDRDPYGIPIAAPPPTVTVGKNPDRGPDPRRTIAETLKIVSGWEHIDYSDIIDDVLNMNPAAITCALCNDDECEPGCPMTRWRGQA